MKKKLKNESHKTEEKPKTASKAKSDSTGKIKIISERDLCGSCNDVVEQFRKLRPGIEIELVYVKPYYSPL